MQKRVRRLTWRECSWLTTCSTAGYQGKEKKKKMENESRSPSRSGAQRRCLWKDWRFQERRGKREKCVMVIFSLCISSQCSLKVHFVLVGNWLTWSSVEVWMLEHLFQRSSQVHGFFGKGCLEMVTCQIVLTSSRRVTVARKFDLEIEWQDEEFLLGNEVIRWMSHIRYSTFISFIARN